MSRHFALAVLLASPAMAEDCAPITRHFEFCTEGTDWAGAEWQQAGDGALAHLGPLTFDFVEPWLGRGDAPIAEELAALTTEMEAVGPLITHSTDAFETGEMQVARTIQTFPFDDRPPLLRASMIAEAGGERVLLMLNAPADTPTDEMAARSREVAGLVRRRVAE